MSNLTKTQPQRLDYVEIPTRMGAIARSKTVIINVNDCGCDLAHCQPKPKPVESKPFTGVQLGMVSLAAVAALVGINYWFLDTQYNSAAAREARATTALLEAQAEASKILTEGKAKAIAEGFNPDVLVKDLGCNNGSK